MKKALSLFLTLVMVIVMIPAIDVTVFAAGPYTITLGGGYRNLNGTRYDAILNAEIRELGAGADTVKFTKDGIEYTADMVNNTITFQTADSGSFTFPECFFELTGNTQVAWGTSKSANSGKFMPGKVLTANGNTTYYGRYDTVKYTVTYEPGTLADETNTKIAVTGYTYGKLITLKGDVFSRAGYIQIGWAYTEDAVKPELQLSQTKVEVKDNFTLYPVWKEIYYGISCSTESLDFGAVGENNLNLTTKNITITNKSSLELTLVLPVDDYFDVSSDESLVIAPEGTANITIKIKEGLACGEYSSDLSFVFGDNYASTIVNTKVNVLSETITSIPEGVTSIGDYAFCGYTSLTSVEIPNSVTSIGYGAFYNCTSLTSITIPDSVTSIGDYAFSNCTSLTSVTIPDSVTSISEHAFSGCTSLTSVTIPDSVTSISKSAFSGCTSLTSVTIPDSVTSIGEYAFSSCTALAEINYNAISCADLSGWNYAFYGAGQSGDGITVNIGANVERIPAYIFCPDIAPSYSPKIIAVNFVENSKCTSIGDYSFYGCTDLTSITIPDSVTSIGNRAFYNCTSLTSITIPDSVTSIGNRVFYYCTSLTSITVGENNSNYSSSEGALFNKDKTEIICYPARKTEASYIIPESVTSISDYAFYCCDNLTSVTIPDSVMSIGDYAFSNCTSLTSVTIGESVMSIGHFAFWSCTSLTEINYNAISCADLSGSNYAFYSAGQSGDGITVNIGANVERIPAYIFCPDIDPSYSPKIIAVNFEENMKCTSIGDYSFYGCTDLTSITIPDSVTSIGNRAFCACISLTSVTIPDSVTSIGDYVFYYCTSLTSITIPDSVTSIGNRVFYYCTSLTSITVDENNSNYSSSEGALFNKDKTEIICYPARKTEASYIIPENVTSIGDYSFYGCTNLTSITIPESVTSIGDDAFYNCTALTKINYNAISCADLSGSNYAFYGAGQSGDGITVNIGANVERIPAYIFDDVSKIVTVNFEEKSKCTSIGDYAFRYCTSLTSITIPDSVTSIGDYALDCSTIYCYPDSYAEQYAIANSINYVNIYLFEKNGNSLDYVNNLITTELCCVNDINNLVYIPIGENYSVSASLVSGEKQFMGTGTLVTTYDESNNVTSEYTLVVNGDTNGDSVVDVLDAAAVAKVSTNQATLDGVYSTAADINGDGNIDVNDYSAVVNKAVS